MLFFSIPTLLQQPHVHHHYIQFYSIPLLWENQADFLWKEPQRVKFQDPELNLLCEWSMWLRVPLITRPFSSLHFLLTFPEKQPSSGLQDDTEPETMTLEGNTDCNIKTPFICINSPHDSYNLSADGWMLPGLRYTANPLSPWAFGNTKPVHFLPMNKHKVWLEFYRMRMWQTH